VLRAIIHIVPYNGPVILTHFLIASACFVPHNGRVLIHLKIAKSYGWLITKITFRGFRVATHDCVSYDFTGHFSFLYSPFTFLDI